MCCEKMQSQLDLECETHADLSDCPDSVISVPFGDGSFGIRIHDGGSSSIEIKFCPWCGVNLSDLQQKRQAIV